MKTLVPAVLALAALAFGVAYAAEGPECAKHCDPSAAAPSGSVEPLALINPKEAPSRGPEGAKVTVVAWSDFQCPYCARGSAILNAISARYGDQVRFVFRNQPLPFHERAPEAAMAALAANEQGRFWEYHDALFAHQGELDRASLEKRAQALGMDVFRFRDSMGSQRLADRLAADRSDAQRLGVTGTPTFFVNGRRITGAQPIESFAAMIDAELSR